MARVTGKYDVDFERGDGGLKSVFGTFIATRLKENKERFKRELAAASPTEKFKILDRLLQERRRIAAEMYKGQTSLVRAMAAGGPKIVTKTETGGSGIDPGLLRTYVGDRLKGSRATKQGIQAAADPAVQETVAAYAERINAGQDAASELAAFNTYAGKIVGSNADAKAGFMASVAEEFNRLIEDPKKKAEVFGVISKSTRGGRVLKDTQGNPLGLVSLDDLKELQALSALSGSGPKQTTEITRRGSPQLDPTGLQDIYKEQLKSLDAQIVKATADYEKAQKEYKGMVRGPDYNMALAPLSTRPSALSQSMEKFGILRNVDPSYARETMAESEEQGRFTAPTPYADLVNVEGAGGKSAIRVLTEKTKAMNKLVGFGFDVDEPRKPRDLTTEEVDLIEGNLNEMISVVDSPLYKGSDLGTLGAGPLKDNLIKTKELFDKYSGNTSMRSAIAKKFAEQMGIWEGSLSTEKRSQLEKQGRPTFVVADAIRKSQAAYDNFLKTRNSEQYRNELAGTYQMLANTNPEIRGLVGDAYLNELDRYESLPPEERLPEQLNFKLSGLLQAADEIAARDVLDLGYQGEIPEVERQPFKKPKAEPGSAEQNLPEDVRDERQGE